MKIEFQCQQCRSTLRLGSEHLGKSVRCPVCGGITQVERSPNSPAPAAIDQPAAYPTPSTSPSGWQPLTGQPIQSSEGVELVDSASQPSQTSSPHVLPTNSYQAAASVSVSQWSGQADGFWWAGLWCGLASIASILTFCCCPPLGPLGSILLAFACVVATLFSRGGPKWINFLLAAIGGGLGVLFGAIAILPLFFGN